MKRLLDYPLTYAIIFLLAFIIFLPISLVVVPILGKKRYMDGVKYLLNSLGLGD